MVKYRAIQPLAFRLEPSSSVLKQRLWSLRVPQSWHSKLVALHQIEKNVQQGMTRLPTRELTQTLHLVAPDIIFFEPSSWTAGKLEWLLSWEKVDCDAIRHITAAWVANNYGRSEAVNHVLSHLNAADLSWVSQEMDFSSWSRESNGTACLQPSYFQTLPHFICAVLTADAVTMEGPWGRLGFVRVCHPDGDPEIISWPPLQYGAWKYSFALRFSVETIPFVGEPLVECHPSIRRWVSQKLTRDSGYHALSYDDASTVYIRSEDPWLTGLPRPRGFSTAQIGLVRENGAVQPKYSGRILEILQRLGIHPKFPTASDLCQEPLRYLDSGNGATVAIVHGNKLNVNHRVTHGVPLPDRKLLFECTRELLSKYGFVAVCPLERTAQKPAASVLTRHFKAVEKSHVRSRLAQCVRKELLVEILHQPGSFARIIRETIEQEFGLGSHTMEGGLYVYKNEELTIQVRERALGLLGGSLTDGDNQLVRKQGRGKALSARAEQIEKEIDAVRQRAIAFVELDDISKDEPHDPKAAIRWGLARSGRLSQFMTPEDSTGEPGENAKGKPRMRSAGNVQVRAKSTVRDGLRQLGYLHGSPGEEAVKLLGLSQPLEIAGVWYLLLNNSGTRRYLPIVVRIDASGDSYVKHLRHRHWLSYPEALLRLSRRQINLGNRPITKEDSQTFFKSTIEELSASGPLLVIASAENARWHWKWLTNKRVTCDKIQWQEEGALSTIQNLRFARVRSGEETPQWYADENGTLGVPAGLFKRSDRVYFGIQGTSVALQVTRAARCSSKVERPTARVAIPRAQEIFLPILQPGDDPAAWAAFVHRTRRMAPQYDGPLKLPLPLHLAYRIDEYIEAQREIAW